MYVGEEVVVYNLYGQFEEIAALLSDTLQRGGHKVTRSRLIAAEDSRLYVVFGANVWSDYYLLPLRYVVVQLEQTPIRKWFIPPYFSRLAGAEQVWDYNLANVDYLRRHGIHAYHVPIGYAPLFDPAPMVEESVDVLFLGQLRNTHRTQVLTALRASGLQVVAANEVFGEAKQRLVAQAKVVLNLHYGHAALLEEARIVPLLAAGKVVVSESVSDQRYTSLYQPYVSFARDTDHLLSLCSEWLGRSASERRAWGLRVQQWVRQQRSAYHLFPWQQVLEEYPSVAYYEVPSEVPAEVPQVLLPRRLHLTCKGWRPVRHYGERTLMRRVYPI
jgi:hypothetical protein